MLIESNRVGMVVYCCLSCFLKKILNPRVIFYAYFSMISLTHTFPYLILSNLFKTLNIDYSKNNIENPVNQVSQQQQVFIKEEDTTNISQVKTENVEMKGEEEEEDLMRKYWEEFTSDLP